MFPPFKDIFLITQTLSLFERACKMLMIFIFRGATSIRRILLSSLRIARSYLIPTWCVDVQRPWPSYFLLQSFSEWNFKNRKMLKGAKNKKHRHLSCHYQRVLLFRLKILKKSRAVTPRGLSGPHPSSHWTAPHSSLPSQNKPVDALERSRTSKTLFFNQPILRGRCVSHVDRRENKWIDICKYLGDDSLHGARQSHKRRIH